ncbi:MAG: trypsin-like serine protease [Hydrogenophilaceae bacterium]|nr:trypsin-like serine protease [Hydrogenophilaceae bacterium]
MMLRGWPFHFILFALCLFPGQALAIIGGEGIDPNRADSPWAGVGSITIKDGGTYSGALISRRHVLTAAHVVMGKQATPADITFNLNYGSDLTYRFPAAAIYLFPDYRGTRPTRDGLWHDDIAVIELSVAVPAGVPVYPLYRGIPGINESSRDIVFVGYGAGDDATRSQRLPPNPSVKRIGRNQVDLLVRNPQKDVGFDLFVYHFADAKGEARQSSHAAFVTAPEALFAGGDSGSPIFVQEGGVWKIAGVATFASSQGEGHANLDSFAAIGGGTLIAPYLDWIKDRTTQTAQPPAPASGSTWIWLAVAAAGTWPAYRLLRRRRAR